MSSPPIKISTEHFTQALGLTHLQEEHVVRQERLAAEQYLMQLRSSPDGLNLAFHIVSNEEFNELRCFWAFNTVMHHLPDIAQTIDAAQATMLYQTLTSWLHRHCQAAVPPDFILNKHAQTMVVGIQELYPSRWTCVFDDLFALLQRRESLPHMYDSLTLYFLRVFEYIDERVVCVRGQADRARQQRQRDMEVKDAMRELVIAQAVHAWYHILCEYRARTPEVARVCLDVVQAYVEWIDIQLIVTPDWMHLLYFVTTVVTLRQSACDCLYNILVKKQQPQVKMDTIRLMGIVEALPKVVAMVPAPTTEEEEAFMLSVVNLANGLAEQVLQCAEGETPVPGAADTIHLIVPQVLLLFSIAHFQVRELTLPFVQQYVKTKHLGENEAGELLHLIYRHTVFGPADWGPQPPDDVIDQRKMLHNMIRLLHRKFPQLVLEHCTRVVYHVVRVASAAELPNCEAEGAMRYLYELGETIKTDQQVLKDSTNPLAQMIYGLLHCDSITGHPDPLVHAAYFELMDRYSQFFVHHPDEVSVILNQLLLLPCGITNHHPRVRSRICYLFGHMLQTLKTQCAKHAENIVKAMNGVFDHPHLCASDKLDLYEGMGTILSVSDPAMCIGVAERVVRHMAQLGVSHASAADIPSQETAAVLVADDIAFLSHLAKGIAGTEATKIPDSPPLVARQGPGFPPVGSNSLPPAGAAAAAVSSDLPPMQVFWQVTGEVMKAVAQWSGSQLVRDRACLFMHQMVNILPHTALGDLFESFVVHMLQWSTAVNELPKVLRVVFQFVNRTRSASIELMARLLPVIQQRVTTMCADVGQIRSEMGVVSEFVKEQAEGYKSYFSVLHAVVHSSCQPALFKEPTLSVLGVILVQLVAAVYVSAEFDLPKQALQILSRLTHQEASLEPEHVAFTTFLVDTAVPQILDALTTHSVDIKDGKNYLVVAEFCQLLFSLVVKLKDVGLDRLYHIFTTSPAVMFPAATAKEICDRLKSEPRATSQFKNAFRKCLEEAQQRRWGTTST